MLHYLTLRDICHFSKRSSRWTNHAVYDYCIRMHLKIIVDILIRLHMIVR